jgi:coenzyme F420-reducing hydrogenase beta subunit
MQNDANGFLFPKINQSKCVDCGKCRKNCPVLNKAEIKNEPVAYAAYNKDNQVRLDSSSGGIFTLISEWIIDNGGVVFGACFDEKFNVIHDFTDTKDGLEKFRGSKYVQSKIGNTFKLAKEFLDSGKNVLFTGTPCQTGGLKSYLKNEYNHLYTQDIICHGVPSPKVWQKYIEYREKCSGSATQSVSFRNKDDGWKKFSVSFLFKNGVKYRKTLDKDLIMRAFLQNICLRTSCHNCSYKTLHKQSDITLADFWGIQNVSPHMDDDKGTSLVLINSAKGAKLFDEVKHNLEYETVDINEAVKYNSAAVKSVNMHKNRDIFFRKLESTKFNKLVKKYTPVSIRKKLKTGIVVFLSKMGLLNRLQRNKK